MRTLRVRRTERRPSSPVLRVTDRDVAVLHGVGRLKFAMTGQLAKLAIHSAYKLATGVRIWIITEADRSATTNLLREEY